MTQNKTLPAAPPRLPGEERARDNAPPSETGGPGGLEPTRFGDWERGGKCVDF